MLVGCYTLSHALQLEPGQAGKLALLLGTLGVYELLLIGLGLFLVERGRGRDGALLLTLELLFLGDATLLSSELFAISLSAGALAWTGVAIMALVKLRLLVRGLGGDGSATLRLWAALVAGFAIPGGFAALVARAWLTPALSYCFWWLGALIALLHVGAGRARPLPDRAGLRGFARGLELLPLASLAVHLVAATWVHAAGFGLAFLAPPLVAVAAASVLFDAGPVSRRARLALPAAAILLAGLHGPELAVPALGLTLSAFRVTLLAAGLVYLAGWLAEKDRGFAWGAVLCLGAAVAGHTPGAVADSLDALRREVWRAVRDLVPRSAVEWGVTAVVSAFLLLGAGALSSLRSAPDEPRRAR